MSGNQRLDRVQAFVPLRPVPRRRLIARIVISPFIWLAALCVACAILEETFAIELGLIAAVGAVAVSLLVLSVLRSLRDQERQRDAGRR
jgi:uncharacterized membrane protein YbhN (UPF0104 family)